MLGSRKKTFHKPCPGAHYHHTSRRPSTTNGACVLRSVLLTCCLSFLSVVAQPEGCFPAVMTQTFKRMFDFASAFEPRPFCCELPWTRSSGRAPLECAGMVVLLGPAQCENETTIVFNLMPDQLTRTSSTYPWSFQGPHSIHALCFGCVPVLNRRTTPMRRANPNLTAHPDPILR